MRLFQHPPEAMESEDSMVTKGFISLHFGYATAKMHSNPDSAVLE